MLERPLLTGTSPVTWLGLMTLKVSSNQNVPVILQYLRVGTRPEHITNPVPCPSAWSQQAFVTPLAPEENKEGLCAAGDLPVPSAQHAFTFPYQCSEFSEVVEGG